MKAQPLQLIKSEYFPCDPSEATHLRFKFSNEEGERMLPIQIKGTRAGTKNWSWNGSTESPKVMPSIATDFGNGIKCHVWLDNGAVQHLSDCTCGLAGTTQELEVLSE